jgi:triosephosphate isomerase
LNFGVEKLKEQVLFINFKTFELGTGKKALELAKIAEKTSKKMGKAVILVVQAVDLRMIASSVSLPVFSQHLDPISFGAHTGAVLPEAIKEAGAQGTVLNHAEFREPNDVISKTISRAKEVGLNSMVCAETTERAKAIALMKPDFIAIEPPELIGGSVSVSTAKPEIIENAVKEIHSVEEIPVIAGAGVHSKEDVKKALELGANGVFVASAILKATEPKKAIEELLQGFT